MYSNKVKQEIVKKYMSGYGSTKLMKEYDIKGSATILNWVRIFNESGINGLNNLDTKTYFSTSDKMRVIKWLIKYHASYPETAHHFHIRHPTIIWSWYQKYLISGEKGLMSRKEYSQMNSNPKTDAEKLKQVEKENELLRAENAYLKKLDALIQKKSKTIKKPK